MMFPVREEAGPRYANGQSGSEYTERFVGSTPTQVGILAR
jgi:hypothetical protein